MALHLGARSAREALSRLKLLPLDSGLPHGSLLALAAKIRESFLDIIRDIEIHPHRFVPVEAIDARLLTRSLDTEVGGHILAITAADLVDRSGADFWSYMFGGKDEGSDVAVVSTCRLAGRSSQVAGARLLKVALHEVGHNFGLLHHYENRRSEDGALCPMTKGDFNRFGERGYLRAVVDARGYRFCRSCQRFLRRHFG